VSNMSRDKNLMKYGFVSVLLLASFLMTVPANQYQKIFAQTEGETPTDTQGNVTDEIQENVTDVEIPKFENRTATFVPPPEDEREAPPVPANATKVDELPDETPPKDPDSVPLSITNRTEILEVLPANSTKIIERVNDDLKNSTGEGLLPPAILDKIISGEGQGNGSILDISSPEELDEIRNFSESTTNQTAEDALDEGEPISISNITNATGAEAPPEEQEEEAEDGEVTNMTNATGAVETQLTNATSGEDQEQEEEAEDQEDQEQEEEAEDGEEVTNMTNATGAVETQLTNATSGEDQEQEEEAEDQEDQEQEEEAEDQEDQEQEVTTTNVTNATARQVPEGLLNTTNLTSMLNATDSEGENDDSEDDDEDE
jgi:hypothetical protein